jgi:hypothetical protein
MHAPVKGVFLPPEERTGAEVATTKWLKDLRLRLGPWNGKALPLAEFAKRLGYRDPSTVKRAERSGRISPDLWRRLHERLRIPLHDLPKPAGRPENRGKSAPGSPASERSGPGGTPVASERYMRAEQAARAFQRSIEDGELYSGDIGGWVLYDVLIGLATLLAKHRAPNADLLDYAEELRKELKPRS